MIYILIIFAKIIEVSLTTIRIKFVNSGHKIYASFISFFEVLLWLYIAGNVLQDIQSDIFKTLSYAFGYAIGLYLGMIIEEKLGVGFKKLEITVNKADGTELVNELRDKKIPATMMEANGKTSDRNILFIYVPRKKENHVITLIKEKQPNCVIVSKDIDPHYGGYGIQPKFKTKF